MKLITTPLLLLFICLTILVPSAMAVQSEEFTRIELDQFIEQQKASLMGKKKMITMAAPVNFTAKMKRFPEEKEMSYIYEAMRVSGVSPLPEVKHRMFIESNGGRILPVYVEKATVEKINQDLKEDQTANFLAYHVYTYSKGPAFLIVDFTPIK